MANKNDFSFEISLSVLNHLGRNLYRSFVTVLGEAISNAWDADAKNVWLYVNKENNNFTIKDDGIGMTKNDFQNKFLKIGYSKRKEGYKSPSGRPYIGRKGIGKLALLSCANRITVISKVDGGNYIGGTIDNSALDQAITDDLTPKQYPLENWDPRVFRNYVDGYDHGTIIRFENIKGGIKNSFDVLKKIIALYFRFSLIDNSFNIYIDGEKVTHEHLDDLAHKTEFLWMINELNDPYVSKKLKNVKERKTIKIKEKIQGFIASVDKPRSLNIMNTDERVSVDLFVNGRLREKDILKYIPTARIAESYLYGQVHFNELDDKLVDRFTSDREGVVSDDSKYQEFLKGVKDLILKKIIEDWDGWRIKNREDGDPENESIPRKQRKSMELYNAVSNDYSPPLGARNKEKIDKWVGELGLDAQYNFSSYAECFISENLVRKYIGEKKIPLSKEAKIERDKWKLVETTSKNKGNVSIEIRQHSNDLSYLSMSDLAFLVDKKDPAKEACLARDANEYKPIRDALAHTALLTDVAKKRLSSVYENIRGRVKLLLSK